jgi:hypothetical protein
VALSTRQTAYLNTILTTAQKLLVSMETTKASKSKASASPRRQRRSSEDAEKMREQILAARAKGVPATKLAEKYGVSTAYIYMIK